MTRICFACALAILASSCTDSGGESDVSSEWPLQTVIIDDTVIDAGDPFAIIDPVWWSGDVYADHRRYVASLETFSEPQRLLFAVAWYRAEVNNGGHHQFFDNSTGIVWPEAIDGLEAIGAVELAAVLREAADRLGGDPSRDREERWKQLEEHEATFEDLDDRFFELERSTDVDGAMLAFIDARRSQFYFEGQVRKPGG